MISYVKIYGPPLLEALKALEKVAVDMPEVCIMDTTIQTAVGAPEIPGAGGSYEASDISFDDPEGVMAILGVDNISKERCNTIISKSGESLGEYDFFFEWFTKPNMTQVEDLIGKIDEVLEPLGVKYTLTTK
jgi:hypothetical protein